MGNAGCGAVYGVLYSASTAGGSKRLDERGASGTHGVQKEAEGASRAGTRPGRGWNPNMRKV